MRIKIKEPFWKERSFGLSNDKIKKDPEVEVECLYKNKQGLLEFPHVYIMSREKALAYPSMVKRKTVLRRIPIFDFSVKTYRSNDPEWGKK